MLKGIVFEATKVNIANLLRGWQAIFFLKCAKLNFPNPVSVTMIVNSVKKKMKTSHPPYDLYISSPPLLVSPYRYFEKLLLLPYFLEISFSPFKNRGWKVENYVYLSKNLRSSIWLSSCSCWNILMFFKCFYYCLLCSIWLFEKIFQARTFNILWPNKAEDRQYIGSILSSTNPMETFWTK